jgi:hypothetical protein
MSKKGYNKAIKQIIRWTSIRYSAITSYHSFTGPNIGGGDTK